MRTNVALFFLISIVISCRNSSNVEEKTQVPTPITNFSKMLAESNTVILHGQQYIPKFDILLNPEAVDSVLGILEESKIIELINANRLKDQKYFLVKNRKVKVIVTSESVNLAVFINGFPLDMVGTSTKKFEKVVPVFPDSIAVLVFGKPSPDVRELKAKITIDGAAYPKELIEKGGHTAPRELTLKENLPFSEFKIKPIEYDKRLQTTQDSLVTSE